MSASPPVNVSAAAASSTDSSSSSSPALGGGMSKCPKRTASVEDADDVLLHVFANYLGMADLLRCAATCRRWRRLIASEAEFICSHLRSHHAVVGFFHQTRHHGDGDSGRRFLPSPSTCSRRAILGGDLFKNSRLVASRRGCLLLELSDAAAAAAPPLRLAVVNLTTGGVFNLPSLAGNDRPERYACAFLTAAAEDLHDGCAVDPPPAAAAGFRVLLLYKKRGNGSSMACRSCCFSSDAGVVTSTNNAAWGPERTVSGANVSSRRLAEMADNGGGTAVFWLSGKVVFGLRLDTLRATVESPKWYAMYSGGGFWSLYPDHRRLTVLPDGRLGAVQLGRGGGAFVVNVFSRNDDDGDRKKKEKKRPAAVRRWVWEQAIDVDLQEPLLPPPPYFVAGGGARRTIRLGAVCEENGLVFFATMDHGHGAAGGKRKEVKVTSYALDLEKKTVQATLVRHAEICCFWKPYCKLVAFMATTPVAYLTSLGASCVIP